MPYVKPDEIFNLMKRNELIPVITPTDEKNVRVAFIKASADVATEANKNLKNAHPVVQERIIREILSSSETSLLFDEEMSVQALGWQYGLDAAEFTAPAPAP
jgi:hypothetical protein